MKYKKVAFGIIAVLILLTVVLAAVHLNTRDKVPERSLMISYKGESRYIQIEELNLVEVSGTVINGKGEEKEVCEQGIAVSDVLQAAGIDPSAIGGVTVTADDAFSAELSAAEINEDGKAYLTDDGEAVTLIVFGDPNSKRKVHNVVGLRVY